MNYTKLRKLDPNRYNKKKPKEYNPKQQVEGLKKRIDAAGIDVEKATDKRNFLEKALNLTPKQNAFFDVLEIINRPQQALFGAISAAQKNEDVLKGALGGLTRKGEDAEIRFKQILHQGDMEDSGKSLGLDDILGFAGDIFLDPVDLAIFPVTKGAKVAGKALDAATDAAKIADDAIEVANAAKLAAKGIKKGPLVSARIKAVNAAKNATETADNLQSISDIAQAAVKTERLSTLQVAARGAKEGLKGSISLADKGITKFLTHIDAKAATKAGLDGTTELLKKANSYKDFKMYIQGIFDAAKSLPKGLWEKATKSLGKSNWSQSRLEKVQKMLVDKIDNVALKNGVDATELGKDLMFTFEGKFYKPNINMWEDVVKTTTQPLDMATAKEYKKILKGAIGGKDIGATFDSVYTKVRLKNGKYAYVVKNKSGHKTLKKFLTEETGLNFVDDLKAMDIVAPRFYSKKELAKMEEFLTNPEYKQLFEDFQKINDSIFGILTEGYGDVLDYSKFPEGYARHVINPNLDNATRKGYADAFSNTTYSSKQSYLKANSDSFTGRRYKLSAKEANEIAEAQYKALGKGVEMPNGQLFSEAIQSSVADFISEGVKFGKETTTLSNFLVAGTFQNEDFVRVLPGKLGSGKPVKVPRGFQAIASDKFRSRLEEVKPYLSPEMLKEFEASIKKLPRNKTLAIDNNILMWIGGVMETQETNFLVKMLDKTNDLFKKTKLLSPGFQMRNFVGNSTNMYLAGMKADDIANYYTKANEILSKGDNILEKFTRGEALVGKEEEILSIYKEFIENNFHQVAKDVYDIPSDIARKVSKEEKNIVSKKVHQLMELNNAMNTAADKRFRLSMLMWAKDNPDKYLKLGIDNPATLVRRALFDPADLSFVEKNFVKRTVPFYTFAKKNLSYQIQNVFDNPKNYKNLEKTVRDLWELQDIKATDIDAYKRENFWIPIPGLTKDGKYMAAKLNLPVGDLAEFMDDPLRRVISSMSPAIRVPFEVTANKQMYSNMPIEEFKGQKGYIMPEISRRAEYALGATGLDIPMAGMFDIGRTAVEGAKGELQGASPFDVINKGVGRSLFSGGDVEKTRRGKAFDELREIEDLMKLYKQKGIDIPKLNDINGRAKMLSNMRARIEMLNRQNRG